MRSDCRSTLASLGWTTTGPTRACRAATASRTSLVSRTSSPSAGKRSFPSSGCSSTGSFQLCHRTWWCRTRSRRTRTPSSAGATKRALRARAMAPSATTTNPPALTIRGASTAPRTIAPSRFAPRRTTGATQRWATGTWRRWSSRRWCTAMGSGLTASGRITALTCAPACAAASAPRIRPSTRCVANRARGYMTCVAVRANPSHM